jgi:hypothetical protein
VISRLTFQGFAYVAAASGSESPKATTAVMASRGDRARLSEGAYFEGANDNESLPSDEDERSEEVRPCPSRRPLSGTSW